ncbi:MAG: response regulator [Phototrophicaceae bacterium]
MRVLIVEDSPDNMIIAKMILQSMGYTVIEAINGLEGFDMTKNQKPDIVIMDYHLPGMNGVEATRKIKNSTDLNAIPIIALTADIYAKQAFVDAGCDAYLAKPIRKASLLRTVNQVLGAQAV